MTGKEITVGILEDIPLPVIEIVPRMVFTITLEIYEGRTQYIIPARISREKYLHAQKSASRLFECSVVPVVQGWI